MTLYASWNGATEVAAWEALAGPGPDALEPVGSAPREGFETAVSFATDEPYVAARAKDRAGRPLGISEAVRPGAEDGAPKPRRNPGRHRKTSRTLTRRIVLPPWGSGV